jgi:hypothetical protein
VGRRHLVLYGDIHTVSSERLSWVRLISCQLIGFALRCLNPARLIIATFEKETMSRKVHACAFLKNVFTKSSYINTLLFLPRSGTQALLQSAATTLV